MHRVVLDPQALEPIDPDAMPERGAACNVDLSDPAAWDFWSVADMPVVELRKRYGIPDRAIEE